MEIIMPATFSLDAVVDAESDKSQDKERSIAEARNSAELEANKILSLQFQTELDEALDRSIQEALNLTILPVSQLSVFSVVAHFEYLNTNFYLRRASVMDGFCWEINYASNSLSCYPESLKSRLLIEMGKLKSQLKENS